MILALLLALVVSRMAGLRWERWWRVSRSQVAFQLALVLALVPDRIPLHLPSRSRFHSLLLPLSFRQRVQ